MVLEACHYRGTRALEYRFATLVVNDLEVDFSGNPSLCAQTLVKTETEHFDRTGIMRRPLILERLPAKIHHFENQISAVSGRYQTLSI